MIMPPCVDLQLFDCTMSLSQKMVNCGAGLIAIAIVGCLIVVLAHWSKRNG